MAKKVAVHQIEISDRAGSLHRLLNEAAEAGVDMLCLGAFSRGKGKGVAYLSSKDPKVMRAFLKKAGLKSKEMVGFAFDRSDRCGATARVLEPLADKKIKGEACLATVTAKGKCRVVVVVDKKNSAKAARALK